MALMKFREPNQVKWVGSRPGHNGTLSIKSTVAENEVDVFYTVGAGDTFYLVGWSCGIRNAAAAVANVAFFMGIGGVGTYYFLLDRVPVDDGSRLAGNFYPPMECPAGTTFSASSPALNVSVMASIWGWVE